MLTSKQLIEQAGISRATLNNYISLGILPKPLVQRAGPDDGRAPRIGYFPQEAVGRVDEVNRLKQEGLSMATIAAHFRGEPLSALTAVAAASQPAGPGSSTTGAATGAATGATTAATTAMSEVATGAREDRPSQDARAAETANGSGERRREAPTPFATGNGGRIAGAPGHPLKVTITDIPGAAYMVNNNFEVVWWNDQAIGNMFGLRHGLQGKVEERNIFRLLMNAAPLRKAGDWQELVATHLGVAKQRMPREKLAAVYSAISSQDAQALEHLYDTAEPILERPTAHRLVTVSDAEGRIAPHNLYISFFREGTLFAYVPTGVESTSLLDILARREQVIRDLLQKRMPFLTHVGVMVADLQNSVQICAELPPEEYFALINDIWQASEPVFRSYYGTHGKHVGDGMVYYFFPQPDCNYVLNALHCAHELKEVMRGVSKDWQARKNWLNELYLNTGLNEGQEWFGTYHTATNIEFTVLGDTINHAARVSDFARWGTVWVTKNMLSRLTPEERERVRFGIRRRTERGDEVFVSDLYARISSLVDLNEGKNVKFGDIATLAVTEVVDILKDEEDAAPVTPPARVERPGTPPSLSSWRH